MVHPRAVFRAFLILLFLAAGFAGALIATMMPAWAASSQVASPGDVVISEFRTRGPNGATDDFVELYNRTASPVNISEWKIEASTSMGGAKPHIHLLRLVPTFPYFLVNIS